MDRIKMSSPFDKNTEAPKSAFKELAIESQAEVKAVTEKLAIGHKPVASNRWSAENMRAWMNKSKITKKSSICALFVGHPKVGKSGVLLDVLTESDIDEGKQLIVYELNSDQGCDVNKKEFHNNNDNIIILNPREYIQDKEGIWQPDYIATMAKIKSSIQTIKEDIESNKLNVKAIGFDGLDIFLSEICESQMRMEEHIDAAGGVSMRFWKNRNKYYYDTLNMIFDIDVDKYFTTHYSSRSRDDKTGQYNDKRTVSKLNDSLVYGCQKSTADKVHQIVEFTDQTRIIAGKKHIRIVATIVADRRSLNTYMNDIVIAETGSDGKIKWNGKELLERKLE